MRILYLFSIRLYSAGIFLASFFNSKAKQWILGRRNIFERVQEAIQKSENIVWFHCASLGELEQGKPLIEAYRKKFPQHKILLTFFSPSGLENSKNYSVADWIFYLPFDSPKNAKRWIDTIRPIKVFFIKYEFWFCYMEEIKRNQIPFYSVSSIFRKEQIFFRIGWFAKQLNSFTHFFVQDETSKQLLNNIGIKGVSVCGDTRFDRVIAIIKSKKELPIIPLFTENKFTIVCGSTWPKDELLLLEFIRKFPKIQYIIAPHEINHCERLAQKSNGLLLSDTNTDNITQSNVLIIDRIGWLSSIYQYGNIAYIGGGFGKGIHNILEAATFGLPVVFGPNFHKFEEAKELLALGVAKSITNLPELEAAFMYFQQTQSQQILHQFIQSKTGATNKILQNII